MTLRQGINPHGFFCLSRVVGTLRNVPWGRLAESRSWQGKARSRRVHTRIRFLGGAMPVPGFVPHAKGSMAHSLRLTSWNPGTPASHRGLTPWERTHTVGGFSCGYSSNGSHTHLVPCGWDTGTFTRAHSLISGSTRKCFYRWPVTCTLFSCSRYYSSLLTEEQKSGNARHGTAEAADAYHWG